MLFFVFFVCFHVDRQVVANDNIQIVDMGKALRLLRAGPADSGGYSCKAVNIAGSAEKDFYVAVLGE